MKACLLLALVAIAATAVSAQTSTGGALTPSTPCEQIAKYYGAGSFTAKNEYDGISAFIVSVATGKQTGENQFPGLFATGSVTRAYFDGSINYRRNGPTPSPFPGNAPNYINNSPEGSLGTLVDHLARFFGAALGCTAEGFATTYPYQSSFGGVAFNQYQVHANMNITQTVFSSFNTQVASAATAAGVSNEDLGVVGAYLASFGRNNVNTANMICTQPSCDCAPGVTGDACDVPASASLAQVSFVTLALVALFALFSVRL